MSVDEEQDLRQYCVGAARRAKQAAAALATVTGAEKQNWLQQSARLLRERTAVLSGANEADLAAALNEGRIAGAAVDVVSSEPIRSDNPLLTARNCLITPHIAWATLAARGRLMRTTAQNVAAFIAGNPINVVN